MSETTRAIEWTHNENGDTALTYPLGGEFLVTYPVAENDDEAIFAALDSYNSGPYASDKGRLVTVTTEVKPVERPVPPLPTEEGVYTTDAGLARPACNTLVIRNGGRWLLAEPWNEGSRVRVVDEERVRAYLKTRRATKLVKLAAN